MKLNRFFFEALKNRLENILKAISGNRKSQIVWGNGIATDMGNKVILTQRSEIVPGVPASLAELLVYYKACVAHEGAHLKYTSLKHWKEACGRGPAFQHLTNIIEDGRIEAAISNDLPGAGRWIRFGNNYLLQNAQGPQEGTMGFIWGLTAYSVCGRIPTVSAETERLIKLAAPHVDIGKASSNTKGVLTCVEEILKIPDIEELFKREVPEPKEERGTGRPKPSKPDPKTKERAKKARQVLKKRKEAEPDTEPEDTEDDKGSEQAGSESSGDKSSDSSNNPETSEDSKDSDAPDDEHTQSSGNSPEAHEGPKTNESEESEANKSGKPDANKSEKPEANKPEKPETKEPETPESPGEEPKESEGVSETSKNEDDFFAKEEPEGFEDLLGSAEDEVRGISKDAENIESEDKEIDPTEGVDRTLHQGIEFRTEKLNRSPTKYATMKEENRPLTSRLVQEIRVALESRKAYDLRGLNRGRLHTGSLWKLAVSETAIFSKRQIPGDIPELAIYILVDQSGSMWASDDGVKKREAYARDAACVLSETCRELKIPHAVTGFCDTKEGVVHTPAVTFADTDSAKIPNMTAKDTCNRDGYSIRVAINEITQRSEPRKILFVLSDGQPNNFPGTREYHGQPALQDVKEAVMEARKKGVRVISIKFGGGDISGFKFMYDTPVFVHDTAMLPKSLGSIFKRVLLEV